MAEILTSQVVSGLATGCVYALIALGFVLIFKATDVVNFAQGEFVMVSGFISYTLLIWYGLPYWLVLLVTIVAVRASWGSVLERVVVRPIMDAPDLQHRHRHHRRLDRPALARPASSTATTCCRCPPSSRRTPFGSGVLNFTAMDVGVIGSSLVDHAGPLSVLQAHQDRHGHAGHRPEPDGGPAHGRERQAHLLADVGDQRRPSAASPAC